MDVGAGPGAVPAALRVVDAAEEAQEVDVKALLGQVVKNVQQSPKAQQELADMGKSVMQQAGAPAQ